MLADFAWSLLVMSNCTLEYARMSGFSPHKTPWLKLPLPVQIICLVKRNKINIRGYFFWLCK